MDNIQFYKSFYFFECNFRRSHHTDNSRGTACHHIGYIKSGAAVFDVEGEIFEFSEGDVFYTPTGCKYHSYWTGERICYDSYAFYNFPQSINEAYGIQKLNVSEKAKEYLTALSENKKVSCFSVGMLYMLLSEVLVHMKPMIRDEKSLAAMRALSFLRENTSLSVPDLSKKMGMSVSALYLLFSEVLKSTPVTEKNRIRCEKAIELLTKTDMSVDDISERLHFSSAAYFRKVLNTFYGKTPREIRKNNNL